MLEAQGKPTNEVKAGSQAAFRFISDTMLVDVLDNNGGVLDKLLKAINLAKSKAEAERN